MPALTLRLFDPRRGQVWVGLNPHGLEAPLVVWLYESGNKEAKPFLPLQVQTSLGEEHYLIATPKRHHELLDRSRNGSNNEVAVQWFNGWPRK
jgi:hypothetical protein